MVEELSFEKLPFIPEEGQVIYAEQSYHEKLNKFIRNNYVWLKKTFKRHNLEFCYTPLQAEEAVAYYAPYLSDEEVRTKARQVPSLSDYVNGNGVVEPSLVCSGQSKV